MDDVRQKYGVRNSSELRCYVEFPEKPTGKMVQGKPYWLLNEGSIVVFIKYYDPFTQTME